MKRILLTILYDGSAYYGWQVQKSVRTIQGVIEGVLYRITGQHLRIYGSGRTDAGVHALGQRAIFDTDSRLSAPDFGSALNALLPDDIRIIDASEAGPEMHPRFSALSKRYFYLIYNAPIKNPFLLRYAWHIKYPIDINEMRQASVYFKGIHDFKSFTTVGKVLTSNYSKVTIREIYDITISEEKTIGFFGAVESSGRFIKITIEADGFLRYMARNIVGTLVDVSSGRIEKEEISNIIRAKNRASSGIAAPPNGLYLERVYYGDSKICVK